ncbi:aminopeptidase [Acetonema longum]|uniref:Putative aminopeptidase n=1 Tax=Acetonema longum DSM 6540 TaxID=1009370 RepID=F7NJE5_9FIRM|nr:aminopeptidase [Acetonema longum]EGO63893.1 putative aminopeptidase [Acetonema longum DSM 6540]
MDPRIQTLAKNLIRYSTSLQPGEKILIEVFDTGIDLAKALVDQAYQAGGIPFVIAKNNALQRTLLTGASEEQMKAYGDWEAGLMRQMQAYIGLRASDNVSELSDVPKQQMQYYQQHWWKPVHTDVRLTGTKWCVLRYPTPSMAQLAGMSTEAFEDFYFKVCNLDYAKLAAAEDPLVDLFDRTEQVQIIGPGTDLTFSIKDIPVVKSCGLRNIPDGEVFTAPVRHSVNGYVTYNTPAIYQGVTYENVRLEFSQGKIIKATSNQTEKLNKVLDTDEGSRYIGEFALGVNPYIHHPMKDTLFDEKICGSFHFTPGNAYQTAFNGNQSAIHWDLVAIQTPEYGGGELWFDDVLIRKDGRFVLPALKGLNPENFE